MTSFEILFGAGALAAGPVLIYLALANPPKASFALAMILLMGFSGFTALTIAHEGVMTVIENHTVNFWGVQVWYDLLLAVGIAVFFIVPRARSAGMNIVPWIILIGLTASIGLLAMIARLFWLEGRNAARA